MATAPLIDPTDTCRLSSHLRIWETASEKGEYGFKVVLAFEYGDSKYELTREYRPRAGVTTPQADVDYQEDCSLKKDGTVLGPDQRDSENARIMPETVSRFFLFDGELLQQYEELLRNDSEMGRNIKEAIERILGVPVLTNGRSDLGEVFRDAQRREAKAAQKNQKTQVLGNQHEALLKQRDGLQKETDRLKKELEEPRVTKATQEEDLRRTEKTKALLDERTRLHEKITSVELRLKDKEDKRKEFLTVSWKGLLNSRIRTTVDGLEKELQNSRDSYQRVLVSADTVEKLRKALIDGHCSTCGQDLSGPARERLVALVSAAIPQGERAQMEVTIQQLESRVAALKQSVAPSNAEILQEVQNAIDELRTERATAKDRLTEIMEQTKDLDEAELRKLYSEHEKTVLDMGILQEGIKKQEEALGDINDKIGKVEAEMAKFADADLDKERAPKELCGRLRSLCASTVDTYRERLREKVEKDATQLFLKLTSEPEYKALSINDNYGLTIVHRDGSPIPVRSAGAEHIVALSLMGALQQNAPMRGPIVVDSPFGRLDDAHTTKVVRALPSMADQIMLLVYESELEPKQARNQLQGQLRKEYRIVRRTARHSTSKP